ncbi:MULTISPECIES: ABC transporter substrate-binding protein [Actinomadura]|uniref:ABC transporter substrate-binding protein n=1 Tax=Actinomadura livida TaxID=79909 RepID=A0A7W7ICB0_9ACTN|nr:MULTISPECIES: ABC transporter substrate-binding protein [Actinomadura]MBB4774284.1 NitT/TauT family transport system substrate-binding protein [Actinomadura catellatispora]TDB95213.1 ABC transporter substrate-binding protein [Actinomadura sp. 7K534]GGT83666.1 sulfonate ABC transporter substrate-binding protein [Actinomadura livida]
MSASHRRTFLGGALAIALGLTVVACGDSDEGSSANGLEKTDITLGTMTVADTAPVQIAIDKGLFKAEGLNVKTQVIQGGAAGIPLLKSGRLDFSFGNYVSLLTAGVKDPGFKPKIVAEGFQSASKTHTLMVRKDSPYRTIKDLEGKKIGVNTRRNISTLLVRAAGKPQGVEFDEDKNFVEVPPPAMEQALKSKSVEAVQAIEPFGTQMQKTLGARMVSDLSSGPTADFPIAGYAATEKFIQEHPKTTAAFQRALQKAQGMAADRKLVQDTLPTYAKGINEEVASTMSYGTFPTTLNATRLQRVADVMLQFGYVEEKIDVKQFIAESAA